MMQIKLETARGLGYTGTAEGLLDPETNLAYAVKYLAGRSRRLTATMTARWLITPAVTTHEANSNGLTRRARTLDADAQIPGAPLSIVPH